MSKVVLVTGASGNLGRAVVAVFARQQGRLALLGHAAARTGGEGDPAAADLLHVAADLKNAEDVKSAVDAVVQRFGRIDVLCNLAGGFRMGEAVHETSDATWDFLMDLNARSILHTARAVVPHMLAAGQGCIVNVGAAGAGKGGSPTLAMTALSGDALPPRAQLAGRYRWTPTAKLQIGLVRTPVGPRRCPDDEVAAATPNPQGFGSTPWYLPLWEGP